MAIDKVLCPLSLQSLMEDGRPLVGAKIYIFETETTTPKTVFKDPKGQAAHPRPILTDAQGRVPPIYVGSGIYRVRILNPNNTPFEDIDGILGYQPPDGSGGEPPAPSGSPLKTGDVIWSYVTDRRPGWVLCNGQTIGQETSGATNIAAGVPYVDGKEQPTDSTFFLYRFLWEADKSLPVYSAGVEVQRGATAASDWNSNRTLGVPDLRGRTVFGLDDMSAPAASVLQATVDITTTAGSATATVSSNSGLYVGMYVNVVGIPEGTIITAIKGLTVTLSALPTSTLTQTKARCSIFSDAQKLGSIGGRASHALGEGEIPSHKHDATTTTEHDGHHVHEGYTDPNGDHAHMYADVLVGQGNILRGGTDYGVQQENRATSVNGSHVHRFTTYGSGTHNHKAKTTIANTGGGNAHNNIPPAVLGTFYMKL